MRSFWEKMRKSTGFWLAVVIIVQTVVYVFAGANKVYIHMDEAYSLALAQYDKIDITANEDFYNTWHTDQYYQDYLALQEEDQGDWGPVYKNQKDDVHPPLYYVLLRGVMGLDLGRFSKWPGIILNIVIMGGCSVLLYEVLRKLLVKEKNTARKALILVLFAGITVAGVSTVVYIRMYALLTLMVLLTLWLHLELLERKKPKFGWYVAIGLAVVLGVLTQYYYLFFLFGLVLVTVVRYVRQKRWAESVKYLGSLVVAGILVLVIWPHILQHMFFGYRGQGVLGNLVNLKILGKQIWDYLLIVDYNVFHHLMLVVAMLIVGFAAYRWRKQIKRVNLNKEFWLIFWPTVTYFGLAAIASPFIELRYIMPVCGLIFVLVMYVLYVLMGGILVEKRQSLVTLGVMIVVLIAAPAQIGLGWMRIELLYRDRQEVMKAVTEKPSVPILYFITTENNRFLDNILPFAIAKESYLALDVLHPTAEEVERILAKRDLSQGLFVFVSSSQNQEEAIKAVRKATGLMETVWIQGINTCDVYYLH